MGDQPSNTWEPAFRFEQTHIRLSDGSLFAAKSEADGRWLKPLRSVYESVPPQYRILYRTSAGHIFVETPPCSKVDVEGHSLLVSDTPPRGVRVSDRDAAEFLLQYEFEIPADLVDVLNPNVQETESQPTRPPEFWLERDVASPQIAMIFAPGVKGPEHLDPLLEAAVMFVQQLRKSDNGVHPRLLEMCGLLRAEAFARYPVDPEHWEWSDKAVPPQHVDLLALNWPASLQPVRDAVRRLREQLQPHLSVLFFARRRGGLRTEIPSEAEENAAIGALVGRLPDIEACIARLRELIAEAKRAEAELFGVDDLSEEQRVKLLKEMAPRAKQAYLSYRRAELELSNLPGGDHKLTDGAIYEHLKEHPIEGYQLPGYKTWERYVRDGRRVLGEQKNKPRRGRTGRSAQRAEDV